jgi:hypothetical protein
MASAYKMRKTAAQVAELRNFHQAGKEMLQIGAHMRVSERRNRKYLIGCRYSVLRIFLSKARQFAEQYTADELDELCALRQPDGSPLQIRHLFLLLRLPWQNDADRSRRAELQKEAAESGWTPVQLAIEIKGRFPKPRRQNPTGNRLGPPRRTSAICAVKLYVP